MSLGCCQSPVFSSQRVDPRRGEEVENRLAERPRLDKSSSKAVNFMKISRLDAIMVDAVDRAQKMMIENKGFISLVGGEEAQKKGAPK